MSFPLLTDMQRQRVFALAGGAPYFDACRNAEHLEVLGSGGRPSPHRYGGAHAAYEAGLDAWEDDATLEIRRLLHASDLTHDLRCQARTAEGLRGSRNDALRRNLLRGTANGLEGDERKAAQRIANTFPGTSHELIAAVRALLRPPAPC